MHHFPDTNVVAHLPRPTQQAKKQSIVSGRLLSHCKQLWAQIDAVPLREVVLVPVLARRVVCAFTFLVEAFWAIPFLLVNRENVRESSSILDLPVNLKALLLWNPVDFVSDR